MQRAKIHKNICKKDYTTRRKVFSRFDLNMEHDEVYGKFVLTVCPRANGAKRRSGRKPGARVTNSARLFTPGKMRTQRSAKFINDCGRIIGSPEMCFVLN